MLGTRPSLSWRALLLLAMAGMCVTPMLLIAHLPLQDYPDLVMHTAVLTRWREPALALGEFYQCRIGLPPRLAAQSIMLLFGLATGPESAGKLTIAVYMVLMPLSVAYLFRSTSHRPSSAELVGFLTIYNFWLFQGSLDYLFGLAVLFFSTGYLLRKWGNSKSALPMLCLLSAAAYLSHIMSYTILAGIALTLCVLERRRKQWHLLACCAAVLPGLLLLGTHLALGNDSVSSIEFSTSMPNKLLAFFMPLMTFFRFEPYATALPVTWANAALCAFVVAFMLSQLETSRLHESHNLSLAGALLLVAALLAPVRVGRLWRFDDRLTLPAYLFLAAGLRFRPRSRRADLALAVALAAISTLQYVQMRVPASALSDLDAVVKQQAAEVGSIGALTVRDYPVRPGCSNAPGNAYSVAVFPTIRHPVYQILELERYHYGSIFTVGFLELAPGGPHPDLVVYDVLRENLPADLPRIRDATTRAVELLELFGCPEDIDLMLQQYPSYVTVIRQANAALLRLER